MSKVDLMTKEEHKEFEEFEPGYSASPKSLSDYEQYRITDLTPIPEPEPVIKISGQTFATREDIFALTGAPKSGKSAEQYMLIAGCISETGQIPDGNSEIEVLPNTRHEAVIHLDSEQARHKHQRNIKNICKRAGFATCPDHLLSYNIRQLDIDKYAEFTAGICECAFFRFGGIHSIWIDGGADYIADVNDPDTSNTAIKYFENLAIKFHTAVFIIVHTNPGSEKERGHFGSQIQRKSGGTLLIKNDGDTSTIKAVRLRYAGAGDIPELMFKYDNEKGYHVGCGTKPTNTDPDAKAQKKITDTWSLCTKIFSGQKSFSRGNAINAIMMKKACQDRTAAGIFALMTAGEMILKGEDNNYRINNMYINELQ